VTAFVSWPVLDVDADPNELRHQLGLMAAAMHETLCPELELPGTEAAAFLLCSDDRLSPAADDALMRFGDRDLPWINWSVVISTALANGWRGSRLTMVRLAFDLAMRDYDEPIDCALDPVTPERMRRLPAADRLLLSQAQTLAGTPLPGGRLRLRYPAAAAS
jgi:hypothetical protein